MVTATPKIILAGIPNLDIGMIAEGEWTVRELAEAFEAGMDLDHIAGIIFRNENGDIVLTKERPDIEDLDQLPFPDYEGFEFSAKNGFSICTSRSCPFNCTFCFHTCGKKYRARSLDSIFAEIDWLVEKYNIHAIEILDELFTTNLKKLDDFCSRIKKYGITWECQMRVDRITSQILMKMKDSGCGRLSFGIENVNNQILKSMEKHITIEQIEKALVCAREAKLNPYGNLLLGDKNDTVESFNKCMEWYQAHPELQLGFIKIMVLPGSKLYQYAVANGYITDELKYLQEQKFSINVTKMSTAEYQDCLYRMDEAVIHREYPAKQVQLCSVDVKKRSARILCKCPSCAVELAIEADDFSGGRNYFCPDCGQYYQVDLYGLLKEKIEAKLDFLLNVENKTIAIWGMGNEGMRIAYKGDFISHTNFYLVDRDIDKQGEYIGVKRIEDPAVLNGKDIDYVLIGTNAPLAKSSIKRYILENCNHIKQVIEINHFFADITMVDWQESLE